MPSEHSPADQSDRQTFPDRAETIGEDPARWLDRSLPELPDEDEVVPAYDRIASIDRIGVLNTWKLVERDLDRGEDGGPRGYVMQRLDERLQGLLEHGERPPPEEIAAVREAVRAEHPEWDEMAEVDRPSRPVPRGPTPGTDRYEREQQTDSGTEASGIEDFAVATDGGDAE
ncbi:hypothetical protein [Halobaculum sp. EA56]|uniref:hypothetical protein n=1 Tax=Halobaculum sp. EA56 TaxID=3421648 RepID=UPI003EBB56CE